MNWVTVLIVVFVGLVTFRAYRNGFVRELVSLSAVILAVPLAGIFHDDMYPKVQQIVDNEQLAGLVSFLAILIAVVLAGQIGSFLLHNVVNLLNLGVLDQMAGAVFGLAKAIIICQAILIALVVFPSPNARNQIDGSPVARRLLDSAPAVLAILPGRFDDTIDLFLTGARKVDEQVGPGEAPGEAPGDATDTPPE